MDRSYEVGQLCLCMYILVILPKAGPLREDGNLVGTASDLAWLDQRPHQPKMLIKWTNGEAGRGGGGGVNRRHGVLSQDYPAIGVYELKFVPVDLKYMYMSLCEVHVHVVI
jgi:hypothetical protein